MDQVVYKHLYDNTFNLSMISKEQRNWDYLFLVAVRLSNRAAIEGMCGIWKTKTVALPILIAEICEKLYAVVDDEDFSCKSLHSSQWMLLGLLTDIYAERFVKYELKWPFWMKRSVVLPMSVFTRRVHENRCVRHALADIGLFD